MTTAAMDDDREGLNNAGHVTQEDIQGAHLLLQELSEIEGGKNPQESLQSFTRHQLWARLFTDLVARSNGTPPSECLDETVEASDDAPRLQTALQVARGQRQREAEHAKLDAKKDSIKQRIARGEIPRTDTANAEILNELFGDELRYDHARKVWFIWRTHWWSPDEVGYVTRLAIEAARQRRALAEHITDQDRKEKEFKWSLGSEHASRLKAALEVARNLDPIAEAGHAWDRDPWLVGVENGVIDLRTGELRPGKQEDLITKHCPVAYDPQAACPRWLQFLDEIFCDNPEIIPWIQTAAGYSLSGDTSEQVLFVLHGTGSNGKSTFLNVLRVIAGDYGHNMPFSALELRARSQIPNEVAHLVGRRFVTASETSERERLNEARVKTLTGGDPITGRFLYGELFTFRPVAKLWLAVNHMPVVVEDSFAFWRRVRLIPFSRRFQDQQVDRHLEQKLREEAPGILNWLVQGCLQWRERGELGTPQSVQKATENYREEMDHVGEFLDERCVLESGAQVSAAAASGLHGL